MSIGAETAIERARSNFKNKKVLKKPKDFECCYNCQHIIWWKFEEGEGQVALECFQNKVYDVRCGNKKNEFKFLRLPGIPAVIEKPLTPGLLEKCENFELSVTPDRGPG